LIQRKARLAGWRWHLPIKSMESTMTLDTIMVVIAVTAMFATLAIVLGRADRQTNGQAKKG
jgi:hypothetical protein